MPARKFISRFSPGRTNPDDLEAIFVQRKALLDDAVERVRESALTKNKHYLLFIGPRGSGKTHLLTLLSYRLNQMQEIGEKLRIAWLNEDETSTSLLDLLMRVYRALEEKYPAEFPASSRESLLDEGPDMAKKKLEELLLTKLEKRTLLVMVENLDLLFESFGTPEQRSMRAFVQNHSAFTIVATAQRLFEGIESRSAPFFGFFQTEYLKFLTVDEAAALLRNIARLNRDTDLEAFLATPKGRSRVRALHHLSGGNHRIYIILSEFISRESLDELVQPFEELVDDLTPYYQERIRSLAPLQRKIVEFLCGIEGTVPVKEIARNLYATHQTTSSQLKALREMGYVESRQDGRESRYELAEPLMRLCVEVKGTKKDQPLRLLVDFLRIWFDSERLHGHLAKCAEKSIERAYIASALEKMRADEIHPRVQFLLADLESCPDAKGQMQVLSELMEECRALLENGKYSQIIQSATKAMSTPNLSISQRCGLTLLRGIALSLAGRNNEATADYSKVVDQKDAPVPVVSLALILRGTTSGQLGQNEEAIADYSRVIERKDAPVEQVAHALFKRGVILGQLGRNEEEIADYSHVIELKDAPVEQVAMALVNRGFRLGQLGRSEEEIADYSLVIELKEAPVEQVTKALVNRGFTLGRLGRSKEEIADYSLVIELKEAPVEQVAKALVSRGFTLGQLGRREEAIADYSRVIELKDAPAEELVMALVMRGLTLGQLGRDEEEVADYGRVIELKDAPVEQLAMTLMMRGVTLCGLKRSEEGIADYSRIVELKDAPLEQVGMALVNRGFTLGQLGRSDEAIADYSRVIELKGATVEQVAMALVNRGLTLAQLGRSEEAIADYSRAIELKGATVEQVAKALVNRGVTFGQLGRSEEEVADYHRVTELNNVPEEQVAIGLFAWAENLFKQRRWDEGIGKIDAALSRCQDQSSFNVLTSSCLNIIAGTSDQLKVWTTIIPILVETYARHGSLVHLGSGLVKTLADLRKAFLNEEGLRLWREVWQSAAEKNVELKIAVRIFSAGIDYLIKPEETVLLQLAKEERAILREALQLK